MPRPNETGPHNDRNGYDPRDPRNNPGPDPREQRNNPGANDPRGGYDPRAAQPDPREQRGNAPDEVPGIPAGDYPVRAVAHKFGGASTNTIQIGVRVKITEGPFSGQTALWYGSFGDNSDDITLRGMDALGFRGGDDIFDCRGFYDPKVQESVAAIAVIAHERNPKSGRMVAKVKFINGGDIVMSKELSKSDEDRFRSRMRATLARRGGSRGASTVDDRQQPAPRDDRRQQAPQNPEPGRPYGESYAGPARGAAPPDSDPWETGQPSPSRQTTRNAPDRW